MKRFSTFLLVGTLALSMLAGCGKTESENSATTSEPIVTEAPTTEQPTTEKPTAETSEGEVEASNLPEGAKVSFTKVAFDATEYKTVEAYLKDVNATYEVYDINLEKDGQKIQPEDIVETKIKLSEEMLKAEGDSYVVFYINGSEITKIKATEANGILTFGTSHFSVYSVVKYNSKSEKAEQVIKEVEEADMGSEAAGMAALKTKDIDSGVEDMDKNMVVTKDVVVRSGPNSKFVKLGTLKANEKIKVIGQYMENGWYKINYNGVAAYVEEYSLKEIEAEKPKEEVVTETPTTKPEETTKPTEKPTPKPEIPVETEKPTTKPVETTKPNDEVVTEKPKPTEKPTQKPKKVYTYNEGFDQKYITTSSVVVRSGPSEEFDKIGDLAKDTIVRFTATCKETGWFRIDFKGGVGYIDAKFLKDPYDHSSETFKNLYKWTTYEGHFGFFYSDIGSTLRLSELIGALEPAQEDYIFVGYYKNGSISFVYNDSRNKEECNKRLDMQGNDPA